MNHIENRARELLADGLRNAFPDDIAHRHVIRQLLADDPDLISARVAVKALEKLLVKQEGVDVTSLNTHPQLAALSEPMEDGERWIGEDGPQEIWIFLDSATNVTGYSETGPELTRPGERAVKFVQVGANYAGGAGQVSKCSSPQDGVVQVEGHSNVMG